MSRNVLVIGGGIIGLSCAYYCAARGHHVTVIDRQPESHQGCSYGNAGMIVPSHFIPLAAPGMVALGLKWMWNPESPFYIKPRLHPDLLRWGWKFFRSATPAHVERSAPLLRDLHLASREAFDELATRTNNAFGLVKKGLVMLCKTGHTLEEEARTAAQARALGVPAEVLDPKQTAALDPRVRMDVAGSVYFPKDCHLDPARLLQALRGQITSLGGTLSWGTELTGWSVSNGKITSVQTSAGDLKADEYVLCGGSWSPSTLRGLGLEIPIQPGKGYSITLPDPRQLPEICAIFTEARVAVTPIGNALRFGGTMEIAGLNESINPVRVQGIIKSIPRYYPEFTLADFQNLPVWHGLRPCSPDGLPYLGRPQRYSNLVIATGHAMMGVSLAPVTGKLVSEILTGGAPSIDLTLLHPDRHG